MFGHICFQPPVINWWKISDILEGQEYIPGYNFLELLKDYSTIENIIDDGRSFVFTTDAYDNLDLNLLYLGRYINQNLGTHFLISSLGNVKPKVDPVKKILYLYITDLANNLYDHYVSKTTC